MVIVKPRKNCLSISGHAGYAEKGKDIVCAGISALWYTLVESLERLTVDFVHSSTEDGEAYIKWADLSGTGWTLVSSFLIGIKELEDNYPEHVKIDYYV